jgi:UDP-glucose 4-epimerase
MFAFIFSGAVCSLIDKIFWDGSLDYISLTGLFTFDLKDLYIDTFIGIMVLSVLLKNKDLKQLENKNVLKDFDQADGLKYVCLRYFNACGADPSGVIGEDHHPETHLIPIIMQVITGLRDKMVVYGDDYPTADGTCVRDYIHVNDLALAHKLALDYLLDKDSSGIFNLGNGSGFSVKEIIEAVKKVTGEEVPYSIGDRRAGDPATLVAASQLACSTLGWQPQYNTIDDIIKTAWKWHENNPKGYKSKNI